MSDIEKTYQEERKKAWRYLFKGSLFLAACFTVAEGVHWLQLPFNNYLIESVSIAGWVALWRPIEMFLYDLPELDKERKKTLASDHDSQK